MIRLCAALLMVVLLAGCADGAKQEYKKISDSETFQTGKKVWNVINFGMNVTNPLYYATKGAGYGYDKYKESKEHE